VGEGQQRRHRELVKQRGGRGLSKARAGPTRGRVEGVGAGGDALRVKGAPLGLRVRVRVNP